MVTTVMTHFEQMLNSSQGKCSRAFLILSLPLYCTWCGGEGEKEGEKREKETQGVEQMP